MSVEPYSIGGYATYFWGSKYGYKSILDKEIRLNIANSDTIDDPFRYCSNSFTPTNDDILIQQSVEAEIFDKYYINPDKKYKELKDEMETNIKKLMEKYGINKLNLTIETGKELILTKQQVELVKGEKIRFNPTATFKYKSAETNTCELVVVSLKVYIELVKEKIEHEKKNTYSSWTEWIMSFFKHGIYIF